MKEMKNPSDGAYMDAYFERAIPETVFKMLANISAIQKFGGIAKAAKRVMLQKD